MAKADMESVFRLLPVHPRDFCLLGMTVNDFYLIDKSLPMGASCSPVLFENLPTFLEWATKTASNSGEKKANKQTNKHKSHTHFADHFISVGFRLQSKSPIMTKISGNLPPSLQKLWGRSPSNKWYQYLRQKSLPLYRRLKMPCNIQRSR